MFNKKIKYLFLFEIVLLIFIVVTFEQRVFGEGVIEDGGYIVNPRVAMKDKRVLDFSNSTNLLIIYKMHGRGNQNLEFEYRPEENGYIIRAGNNEQRILKWSYSAAVSTVMAEPINEYTKFPSEYIWEIKSTSQGYYTINSKGRDSYMTVKKTTDDSVVSMERRNRQENQEFNFQSMNGIYRIRSARSVNERDMVWSISDEFSPINSRVTAKNIKPNDPSQEWLMLYKPNINSQGRSVNDGYVFINNADRRLIVGQPPLEQSRFPLIFENDVSFDQIYEQNRTHYFDLKGFSNDGNLIMAIKNSIDYGKAYSKGDDSYGPNHESTVGLSIYHEQATNPSASWEFERISGTPKPVISNIKITSKYPEEKDFFFVGEKIELEGNFFGEFFNTYDLYARFNTDQPVLIQKDNPIAMNGTASFKTVMDTSNYLDGIHYMDFFARADSVFPSNKVSQEYEFKYPTPTGKAVPQSIHQGTPLSSLKAADFVTDLRDEVGNDITVDDKIIGLDTNREGTQMAKITIRNQHKATVIDVPVSVGLVWGNVPWYFNEGTGELVFTDGGILGNSGTSPWNRQRGVDSKKIKTITFTKPVIAPDDSSYLFSSNQHGHLVYLEYINGLTLLDTSNVKDMSFMFSQAQKLKEADMTLFDTSKVTKMNQMFLNMKDITYLNLESFDTISASTNTNYMFSQSNQIKKITLGEKTRLSNTSLVQPKKIENEYTGNWQAVGNGTIDSPLGEFIGSVNELERLTQDDTTRTLETYVWEPAVKTSIAVNYYQIGTKNKIIEDLETGIRKEAVEKKDINYQPISIKEMLIEQGIEINPEFEGYQFLEEEIIVFMSNQNEMLTLDSPMPKEDITVNFYFDSTVQFSYPESIDFGNRPKSKYENIYPMKPNNVEEENYLSIIDTIESNQDEPNWTLSMSTTGFYHADSGVRLLADLMITLPGKQQPIMITSEGTPIVENSNDYKQDISLSDKGENEGLAVRVAKVDKLGQYNGVLKYQLQVVP